MDVVMLISPKLITNGLRDRLVSSFDALDDFAAGDRESPAFLFLHVPGPHPPLVVDADGQTVPIDARALGADDPAAMGLTRSEYAARWESELAYLNRARAGIGRPAAGRRPEHVILVMADHGYAQEIKRGRPRRSPIQPVRRLHAGRGRPAARCAHPGEPHASAPERIPGNRLSAVAGSLLPVAGPAGAAGADRDRGTIGRPWRPLTNGVGRRGHPARCARAPRLTAVPKPLRLVLLSCLMLFVELALIRWTGSNVVHLSYFSNFVLLGSFLGIGVGFLRARARVNLFPYAPVALALLVGLVLIFPVRIDRSGSDLIYFGQLQHLRPAAVGHPAVHLRGGRRRDGHDRGGRGAHLRRVRAAGGVPLRHRRLASWASRPSARCRFTWAPPVAWGVVAAVLFAILLRPEHARPAGGGADRPGLHAGPRVDRARVELVAVLQDQDHCVRDARPPGRRPDRRQRLSAPVGRVRGGAAGAEPRVLRPVPARARRFAGQRPDRWRRLRDRCGHRAVRGRQAHRRRRDRPEAAADRG